MILDKLMEKKDLKAYSLLRTRQISECKKAIKNYPAKDRSLLYARYNAILGEVHRIVSISSEAGGLRKHCIENWKEE